MLLIILVKRRKHNALLKMHMVKRWLSLTVTVQHRRSLQHLI